MRGLGGESVGRRLQDVECRVWGVGCRVQGVGTNQADSAHVEDQIIGERRETRDLRFTGLACTGQG